MAGYEQKQFVTNTINQYDVLTGRGSGPYEQPGNVHFRDLVSTRKIEYLSLNARDSRMKNQIAKDITATHDFSEERREISLELHQTQFCWKYVIVN